MRPPPSEGDKKIGINRKKRQCKTDHAIIGDFVTGKIGDLLVLVCADREWEVAVK